MGRSNFTYMYQNKGTVISTSHATAIYMPATNMPLKCHIFKLSHIQMRQLYQYICQM